MVNKSWGCGGFLRWESQEHDWWTVGCLMPESYSGKGKKVFLVVVIYWLVVRIV